MSGKRLAVLAAVAVGAALIIAAGATLWQVLPKGSTGLLASGAAPDYVPPEVPVVLPEPRLGGVRVALVEEPQNAHVMSAGYYEAELTRWRDWLGSAGASLTPARDAEVLVIPSGECLGAESRALIQAHLSRGGGIVSTGALGARDGYCGNARDTVLVQLLGRVGDGPPFATPAIASPYMVLLGETMLAAGAPAGARIDLQPMHHLVFRGPERELYFSDYRRVPRAVAEEPYFDGAVARALVGPGRVVAFGFGISEVGDSWSEQVTKLVVQNAVTWASGRPVVQLGTWPDGHEAAAVVAQDVEADYGNATAALRVIEEAGIPSTYFIVGQLARAHPFVTRRMARAGEIGSHSFHHDPMDAFSDAGQREELALGKRSAEDFAGRAVGGFRPPEERFTVETLRAWAELGGDYFFASDRRRSAVPVMVPFGPDSLVFIGRVVDDDFAILSQYEMRDRSAMARSLVRQIDDVIAYRGAYMFSYHSHMLAQEQLVPVLEAVVTSLQSRPEVWLTTAGEVSRWWRVRHGIELEAVEDGSAARLRNAGRETFRGGSIIVDLPDGTQRRVAVQDLAPGETTVVGWEE